MTDTVLSRFFLQTNGSKGCSKNKKSTQRSQQQQPKEITLNDGWWWWMLAAAAENQTKAREKQCNNLLRRKPKSFGKPNQQQQYQKLRKRCKSSQRESSRTLSLSLRIIGAKKHEKDRTTTCV
jgi:hypothetical protein